MKKTTSGDSIRLFWHHATRYPALVISILVGTPLTVLAYQFLPPLIIADIINRLSDGDYIKGDIWGSFGPQLIGFSVLTVLGMTVAWRVIVILLWRLEANVLRDLNQRIFDHLLKQSADFHANHFGGSMVAQSTKLVGAYVRFVDTTVFQLIPFISSLLFTIVLLAGRAPLFVILLVAASAIYMVSAVFVTRKVRRLNAEEATLHSKQTGILADSVTNVMAIKSFSGSKQENSTFAKATEATRAKTHALIKAVTYQDLYFSSVTSVVSIMSVIMATAGVVLYHADLATAFLIVTYTARVSQGLWEFSGAILRNYNRSLGDSQEMTEILGLQPEVKDPMQPQKPAISSGKIVLSDVQFTHSGSKKPLFDGLNIRIKPGEKIGLVGHSGSGKTTLTRLLLRFSDIQGGSITIDGQNIADITQDDLRRFIAYVPQEPLLFHRSIQENIAYGQPGASKEQVIDAAQKANADEFIATLPEGYKTMVGERGVKLSGGQRQRIAIARAILKDAPILVLDEATSALDSESEVLIQSALQELMQERTAIVIAHRLSTIQKMDRIIVMDNGVVIEEGTHGDLVAKNGRYAQLWAHQSGGFIEA